jgi:Chaperonin GroEL (HSP60 family)
VRKEIVSQVLGLDVDALICQKSIDETVRNQLFHRGVLVVERTRQDEFDAIVRMTGSSPVQSVDSLTLDDTGCADAIEHQTVGTTPTLTVRGITDKPQTSLLLRGGTEHVSEEVRRIINDCIDVVRLAHQDGLLTPGGGAAAVALADDVLDYAASVSNRTQLAIEAFAEALKSVPRVLARNAGQDPIDTITALQHRHYAGERTVGIDSDGNLQDMAKVGVVEPAAVFYTALGRAVEAASLILRIDDVIATGAPADHDKAGHAHDGHNHDEHSRGGQATGGYPWAVGH